MSPVPIHSDGAVRPLLIIGYGGRRSSEDFTIAGCVHIDKRDKLVVPAAVLERLNDGRGALLDFGMTFRTRCSGEKDE